MPNEDALSYLRNISHCPAATTPNMTLSTAAPPMVPQKISLLSTPRI